AVPTPINNAKLPDLSPVEAASRLIADNMKNGATVIFESTVYPGVTEEICQPILEASGKDFRLGYSPERINPGDKVRPLESIVKIVSGQDAATLADVSALYQLIIHAGVHEAPSIKVAEAAKILENTQRDVNIALMNEFALICHRAGIDTQDV
ncbi:nucleotide sugar dehydrogenase, partial [Leptospira interrogans serovar Pomona]|nr:nucleotide sugar dehydrogenase [Leptospira interrogans serovar Pomona]